MTWAIGVGTVTKGGPSLFVTFDDPDPPIGRGLAAQRVAPVVRVGPRASDLDIPTPEGREDRHLASETTSAHEPRCSGAERDREPKALPTCLDEGQTWRATSH